MKHRIAPFLAALLLALLFPAVAFAACANPAGNAADMIYNNDYHVLQYCNGTSWIGAGPTGAGGAGCSSPAGNEADIIFNDAYYLMQYCNGAQWVAMGPATGPGGALGGMLAWWKLDDGSGTSAADSSGNGHTGTFVNTPTWTTGNIGCCALTFNGAHPDYVHAGGSMYFGTNSFSYTAWINQTLAQITKQARIVVGIDTGGPDAGCATTSCYAAFNAGTMTPAAGLSAEFNDGVTGYQTWSSTTTVNDGAWHHVALVVDRVNNQVIFYTDGVATKTVSFTFTGNFGTAGNPFTTFAYGGQNSSTSLGLTGSLDDVRVYSRALGASEIAGLATGGGEGDLMYNSAFGVMQYFNGENWVGIGGP